MGTCGEKLIENKHNKNFYGDGNALYLDWWSGYTGYSEIIKTHAFYFMKL